MQLAIPHNVASENRVALMRGQYRGLGPTGSNGSAPVSARLSAAEQARRLDVAAEKLADKLIDQVVETAIGEQTDPDSRVVHSERWDLCC